jgi:formate-dependent nitrite reductase membrane component NrfD
LSATGITYYDRPVLKEPVWIWTVPAYIFVGGVAGAAMTLGLAVELIGGSRLRAFDERCRWIGAVGGGIGSALLIADLGRKSRFFAMLRVLRPSSPMSIGSWVLATATPLSAGSALLTLQRDGVLRAAGQLAGASAGILGMPLATYTAVLLGNSAVPLWLTTRNTMPLLFGASSAASLGSVFDLMRLNREERSIATRFQLVGRVAELAAAEAVERQACSNERVGRPLREGVSGAIWQAAKVLNVASLVLTIMPGNSKMRRRIAGVCGILGGIAVRFAIFHAGKASTRDPRATFEQQR